MELDIPIVTVNGNTFAYDAVVNLMDDDLREWLHLTLQPASPQEFTNAYCIVHRIRFGEDFTVN
jgi:hypothetical protein